MNMTNEEDLYTFSAHNQTHQKKVYPSGVTIEAMHSTLEAETAEGVMCLPQHTLFMTLASDITVTEAYCETGKPYQGLEPDGNLSFVPAHLTRWSWHAGTYLDWVAVFLDPEILTTCVGQIIDNAYLEFLPFTNIKDPLLYQLVLALKETLQSSGPADALYVDSLSTTLSMHLMRRYSNVVMSSTPKCDRIGRRLYQAVAYLNDYLAETITLEDLARLTEMNKFSFCRAFKQALGKTPYQYQLHQRIQRATKLLTNSELSLAEIAIAVGFYDHSHFTNQFRRVMGLTPSAYRKAVR